MLRSAPNSSFAGWAFRVCGLAGALMLTAQGADIDPHWAFDTPRRAPVPAVRHQSWARNAIDHFILERLEKADLEPSPPAEPRILIRRLYLDGPGLPPT